MTVSLMSKDNDPLISIKGDSLRIDPTLTPKPSSGLQVMLRFVFKEVDGERQIVGVGSLWDNWDITPEPADADAFDDIEGFEDLEDTMNNVIALEDFRALNSTAKLEITLDYLAYGLLHTAGRKSLEDLLLGETMGAFLQAHTVTARLENMGGGIAIMVDFERHGQIVYTFMFEEENQVGIEQLFQVREPAL